MLVLDGTPPYMKKRAAVFMSRPYSALQLLRAQTSTFATRATMVRTASPKQPLSITPASRHISSPTPPHPRPLSHSAAQSTVSRPPNPTTSKPSTNPPPPSSSNVWAQVRSSPRAIRYTLYTGLALAATAETIFWLNVIHAKCFAGEKDREKADELLDRFTVAVRGYRQRYLINYTSYYSNGVWGL